MTETKPISPLLDGFDMGASMGSHDGVTCYPAIKENTDSKYIIKFISVPSSQVQLDALLLTGAYKDPADAMDYFKEVAENIVREAEVLQKLSKLDGFLPYESWQILPMENGKLGYDVCLIGSYKRSLQRYMRRSPMTHLEVINLGLDLCQSLAICRRAGYLYVDLKPSNVFISKGKEYRIGDLGFVALDSLRYTSLPGRYRSGYSPREVQDDFKTLNDTVDTYAAGMILYQIYNDGNLPAQPKEPTDPFPAPANADYEVAEIILKALAPDPADRWHDPMEMGQALVAYMQRNTVNNTPITPPRAILQETDVPAIKSAPKTEAAPPSEAGTAEAEVTAEPASVPDQADAMLTEEQPVETPVAVADPPVPAPAVEIDEDEEDFAKLLAPEPDELDDEDFPEDDLMDEPPVKTRRSGGKGWILVLVLILLLGGLGFGGYWFYQNIYLQTIDELIVDGTQNQITVTVDSETDEALLTVICSDTYGNSTRKQLQNGQAVFTDLLPNSQYKIRVEIEGFHELTGETAGVFNTEAQTHIVSISAVTGPENGSVVLNFTVDGTEPDEWSVSYSADGEEEQVQSFTGHTVTIRGLTVGQLYTFRLDSSDELDLLGKTTAEFTASQLIMAQNLSIVSCENGVMTVRWNAPEDTAVTQWDVRCYNDSGYEVQTSTDTQTEVVFEQIDTTQSYTVEVTAKGMTQPARVSLTANPITVSDITVAEEDPEKLTVSWDHQGAAPEGGWLLMYSMDGTDTTHVVKSDKPSCVVAPRVHGAKYHFQIQTAEGTTVFNSVQTYTCPNAQIYNDHSLSAEHITANMLKTPDKEDWSYKDISTADYTASFQSGDRISVILHAGANFYIPEDSINILYVIRDSNGNVLSDLIGQETQDWAAMWLNTDYHYCELDIPKVPTEPGSYSLSLYFNGKAVTVTTFSIAE